MQLSPALQPPFSFHLGCSYDKKKKFKNKKYKKIADLHSTWSRKRPLVIGAPAGIIAHMPTIKFQSNRLTYQRLLSQPLSVCLSFRGCHLDCGMQLKHSSTSLTKSCGAYTFAMHVDDLLIASSSPEEHKHHLRQVLEHLNEHGVIINPSKCVFRVAQLQFLGHQVDSKGKSFVISLNPLPSVNFVSFWG